MSNAVFPTLAGMDISVKWRPRFNTLVQVAASGAEQRVQLRQYPMYEFDLKFNALRSNNANVELQNLLGFYMQRSGQVDSFLWTHPEDNSVTAQGIGTGDGTTASYQLVRSYGGFVEPVMQPNGVTVFVQDWEGNQQQYPTARTNLVLQSQTIGTSPWVYDGSTGTANALAAPNGTTTATMLTDTTANAVHRTYDLIVISAAGTYTASVYLKAGTITQAQFALSDSSTGQIASIVNLSTGVCGAPTTSGSWTNGSVSSVSMGNGWWRYIITGTTPSLVLLPIVNFVSGGLTTYTGTGTGTLYAWGAQAEAGSVATSYIPTVATAVTVTDYTLSPLGVVTCAPAPNPLAAITWTGTYYYRCRFVDDANEFERFLTQYWQASNINLLGCLGNKIL